MDHSFLFRQERCRGTLPLKKRKLRDFACGDAKPASALGWGGASSYASLSSLVATATSLPPLPDLSSSPAGASGGGAAAFSPIGFLPPLRRASNHPAEGSQGRLVLGRDEHFAALALLSAATGSLARRPFASFPPQVPLLLPSSAARDDSQAFIPGAGKRGSPLASSSLKARIYQRQEERPPEEGSFSSPPPPAKQPSSSSRSSSLASSEARSVAAASTPNHDRRYTGAPGERRCQATTTRGRPCAYVAAAGSSSGGSRGFCHMHASTALKGHHHQQQHQQHQQRRASSLSSSGESTTVTKATNAHAKGSAASETHRLEASSSSRAVPREPAAASTSCTSFSTSAAAAMQSPPAGKTEKSSSFSRRRAKHKDSPHPLLSKVPVDRWHGTSVRIACGPMAGKTGTVDKWGNGWITVQLPGFVSHNRRSFELYVVDGDGEEDEDDDEAEEEETTGGGGSDGAREGAVSTSTFASSAPSIDELNRSTVSPSPSSEDRGPSAAAASGKCPGAIVHKVSYSYDGDEATPRPNDARSVIVLDTPQNDRSVMAPLLSSLSSPKAAAATTSKTAGPNYGRTEILEAHKITPVSPKKARTELPLAESLALAQEGGAKKYRIDMLFGTAALERSRRSVHNRPPHERGEDPPGGGD